MSDKGDTANTDSVNLEDVVSRQDSVKPEDSVSQQGTLSTSSRLRTKARRAALVAEAAALREQQELEFEEFRLQQRKAELLLRTKLRIAEAEEVVYETHCLDDNNSKIEHSSEKVLVPSTDIHANIKDEPEPSRSVEDTSTPAKPACGNVTAKDDCDSTIPYPAEARTSSTPPRNMNPEILQHLHQGQRQHQELLETISISNADIMNFDGNPLKYFEFIRAFDSIIGRSSLDENAKLLRLYHLCTGAAKDIIQCCLVMAPTHGYTTARRLLADRFGNIYHISEAWVRKVTDGPAIPNSPKHLREFADTLNACAETLKALGMIHEISNRRELLKIVERLPFHLRSRWLRQVKGIRDNNRNPNIMDVVRFINDVAEELNDPVFGTLLQSGMKTNKAPTSKQAPSRGNFAASETSAPTPHECILCKKPHSLFGCSLFKEMKPDKRFNLAQQHRLCFNCLRPGHICRPSVL